MALDKFFCKVPETKVTDKQIEFHSEKEANEYCREHGIDPHNVILMGDKYIVKTKDSNFRTAMDVRCNMSKSLDKAIRMCDAVDDIYVRRSNEYYVNVKLGKSNPQISATISRILNKDKRVDGVLGSPGNWDVAIEGKDNAEYIKKILSGVGNIK